MLYGLTNPLLVVTDAKGDIWDCAQPAGVPAVLILVVNLTGQCEAVEED